MKITQQEQDVRKERIIREAYGLFCEFGIDSVPLKEVAKKAGVSPNSIYRYFDTKAALLHCTQKILWVEIMDQLLLDSREQLLCARNGFEEVEVLLFNFQKFYEQHSSYLLFACEYKQYLVRQHLRLSWQIHKEMLDPVYRAFIAALSRGQLDGSISMEESVETQFFVLWGVIRGFLEEVVVYDRIYDGAHPWQDYLSLVLLQSMNALGKDTQQKNRGRG